MPATTVGAGLGVGGGVWPFMVTAVKAKMQREEANFKVITINSDRTPDLNLFLLRNSYLRTLDLCVRCCQVTIIETMFVTAYRGFLEQRRMDAGTDGSITNSALQRPLGQWRDSRIRIVEAR